MIDIRRLYKALEMSWGADTARGAWNSECPSMNQCCVTALIIQDYLGGKLLKCPTQNKDIHYWNRIWDGSEIDLTADQFSYLGDMPLKSKAVVINRNRPLAYKNVVERYEILKKRVEKNL